MPDNEISILQLYNIADNRVTVNQEFYWILHLYTVTFMAVKRGNRVAKQVLYSSKIRRAIKLK